MTTGLLITSAGQAAIAADLGGGANLVLSHVAFGDAGGVPYTPVVGQAALVNERYRATIASVAVLANEIIVDAILPADTPDGSARPSHGFNVWECGLFSSAGTMIGVARMSGGYKPPPSSGQASVATFRLKLAVSNPSAITVVIDPQAQVILGRHVRPFWMTVDGVQNAPPAVPVIGSTYIIGAAPTGAWTGFANRLAQWVGVWSLALAPVGHIVSDASRALDHVSRFLRWSGATWNPWLAGEAEIGPVELANDDECRLAVDGGRAVTPRGLLAFLRSNRDQPEAFISFTTPGSFNWTVPANVRSIRVRMWGGGGGGGYAQLFSNTSAPSGGGSGAYAERTYQVSPGAIITGAVGAGGIGGDSMPRPGQSGLASSITVGGSTMTAGGGTGGLNTTVDNTVANAPAGGAASGGIFQLRGEDGHIGTTQFGTTAVGSGGSGAAAPLGGGTAPGGRGNPGVGNAPGGGGGATSDRTIAGGVGANGRVDIFYVIQ